MVTLQFLRHRAGLTQKELAFKLGVTRVTIIRWEMGATRPTGDKLLALAEVLKVPADLVLRSIPGPEKVA